jgi:hypothetical protein
LKLKQPEEEIKEEICPDKTFIMQPHQQNKGDGLDTIPESEAVLHSSNALIRMGTEIIVAERRNN